MNAMPITHMIDPKPVLDLIEQKGGECSFDEAMDALVRLGIPKTAARDGLWQLLSDGSIEFTADRKLAVPKSDVPEQVAG
jgi:hypothetical protein